MDAGLYSKSAIGKNRTVSRVARIPLYAAEATRSRLPKSRKPPKGGFRVLQVGSQLGDKTPSMRSTVSALTRLETRVGLADHEDLAAAAHDFAIAVAGLRRLQGGQDLHDETSAETVGWMG
jgi:hypothetical protein